MASGQIRIDEKNLLSGNYDLQTENCFPIQKLLHLIRIALIQSILSNRPNALEKSI